jgi:hypothetical protein
MKLPKLFPFKRNPEGPKPERTSRQADGLSHARQQVMGQMQARRGGGEPPPPEPPSIPPPAAASQPDPSPSGERPPPAAPSQGMEDVLAAAASAQEAEQLDPDLLDIFREAKDEAGDSSFADGLERSGGHQPPSGRARIGPQQAPGDGRTGARRH